MLTATHVARSFSGIRALADASLEVRAGEIHALVGENGAGKSTLVNILTGALAPDAGRIVLDGAPVDIFTPQHARQLGIVAIHQHPALFPDLSVAENLAIGLEDARWWSRVDWRGRRARARDLLAAVGARIDVDREAASLSLPEQQLVEMARALGARARVLLLDEPTASLTPQEVDRLFALLADVKASGTALVYISHRLEELPRLADRVTVLRDGRTVSTHQMADVNQARVIQLMVRREVASVYPPRDTRVGDVVLELDRLTSASAGIHDVTLSVRQGEIVGLAGLVGAGRTELARVLFGLEPIDSGRMRLGGRDVAPRSPAEAIAAGIAYLPEDRRRHGVVLDLPVTSNLTMATLSRVARHGLIDREQESRVADRLIRALAIKTPSPDAPVRQLSGGNQQKVALGRWLVEPPRLLVLDEPTQGVDVGAKAEIHRLIGSLAADGLAVLMISSELPEVLGMSDRIVVMRGGTTAASFAHDEATPERVMSAAFGTAA